MTWSPRVALWSLRGAWAALAVLGAAAVQDAADGRAPAAGTTAAVVWWITIGIGVVALAVPGVVGLAVVRLVGPLAPVATVAALVLGADPLVGGSATVVAVVVGGLSLSAESGEAFVQGSAYGQETRFPLRPPAAMLPAVVVSWVVWAALVVAATLSLSAGAWVPGAALAGVTVAASWWVVRAVTRLCRRWLVLVPAGLVVHDPLVLAETLMVQRGNLRLVRLALADTEAFDLTGPCGGHALEVSVRDMELVALRPLPDRPQGGAVHVQSFLVAPSRPGRALRTVAGRGLPTG